MAWYNFFKRKDARNNHMFDDKDRELSLERKRMNIELENAIKKNKIEEEHMRHELAMAEMQNELEEIQGFEEDEGENNEVTSMLMALFDKAKAQAPAALPQITPPPLTAAGVSYSDSDLMRLWNGTPSIAKSYAPKCTDEQVKEFIKAKMIPDSDEDSVNRALKIVRDNS